MKRIVSIVLAVMMMAMFTVPAFAAAKDPTATTVVAMPSDTATADEKYRTAIDEIASYGGLAGLLDSNNKFNPMTDITMAEFRQIAKNLFGKNIGAHSEWDKSTVATQKWATEALAEIAKELKSGIDWHDVDQTSPIWRAQACLYFKMTIDTAKLSDSLVCKTPHVGKFTDVAVDAYYADAVTWALDKKITSGTSSTTFSPEETCTVEQIVTFLYRTVGKNAEPKSSYPFLDDSHYAYKPMSWAVDQGLIDDLTDLVGKPCTRAMVTNFLHILAGKPTVSQNIKFNDVPTTASFYNAVKWAVRENITSGTSSTTFSPYSICTRGQIVTFLYRAYA